LAQTKSPTNETPPAVIPDPTLTPGSVRTTDVAAICAHGTAGERHWSRERDDRIMAEYGLPPGPHPDYEVDHMIPLCVGGADDDRNLWAEPRRSIEPMWNAERKDELERRLCELACSGAVDVREAQREIAEDWINAWDVYASTRKRWSLLEVFWQGMRERSEMTAKNKHQPMKSASSSKTKFQDGGSVGEPPPFRIPMPQGRPPRASSPIPDYQRSAKGGPVQRGKKKTAPSELSWQEMKEGTVSSRCHY
jgi:hypothetical protein